MPVALRIRTRNLETIRDAISALPRSARGIATEEASKYIIGNQQRGLRHYPAQRPGQKYVRTYRLRYGWQVSDAVGVKKKIFNNTIYAPYVQGDEDQAWMHVGRWRTVSKVIADNMQGALHRIEQVLQKWLKQKGLS